MKQKTYPSDITDEVKRIGDELNTIFKASGTNLRTLSKFSSMSVNSVKAVLAGNTANIASYSLVAKALSTNLIDVVTSLKDVPVAIDPAPVADAPAEVNPTGVELNTTKVSKPMEEDVKPTDILL